MRKVVIGSLLFLGLFTATAVAFSTIFSYQGTIASYDFGGYGPGHNVPGTVEIQAFTMKQGDVVPWHFHKGLSYVILVKGNLTEQELTPEGQCGSINEVSAGSAFVEPPGRVHQVINPGPGSAIIYWATVFPQGDPNGDATFVNPPDCH